MIRADHRKPAISDVTFVPFDMDGTLVDSAEGVTWSVAAALKATGIPGPTMTSCWVCGTAHDRLLQGLAHRPGEIPTVFVTWGYGKPDESAEATAMISWPSNLIPLIL